MAAVPQGKRKVDCVFVLKGDIAPTRATIFINNLVIAEAREEIERQFQQAGNPRKVVRITSMVEGARDAATA